jgi:tetratricopeptide (TPR) repeat protein
LDQKKWKKDHCQEMNKKLFTPIKALFFVLFLLFVIPGFTQSTDEKYTQAIESADKYFDDADYLNAKASYQIAAQVKPVEQYPKDRLKESIRLLRIQMQQMGLYNEKVSFADGLLAEQSYDNAILAYDEALKMMPGQEYPQEQIDKIRRIQSDELENMARYSTLIHQGDALFADEKFAEAMQQYEEASALYPERQEAIDKITASNARLSEITAQQSDYDKAISEAEMYHTRKDYENELLSYQKASVLKPVEALPQIKIRELNEFLRKYEAYNKFVSEGDDLYISQEFAEAKIRYERALEILPDENYPKEIISKIHMALTEKTEKNKAAYDEAIDKADALFRQEDYDAAMLTYSDALRFWPDGEHAKARMGSISEIMALRKAQEEAYTNSITLADKLFADEDYTGAKAEYRKAIGINPFEQYPKVRIDEIDMILTEIQNKLEQYESIIQGADKLFNVGDYAESRIQYLKAMEILVDRTYPEDQIRMIDEILGLENATRDAYLAAIARGDEHFAKREWEDAKTDYVEASDLITEEQYPKDKITEINRMLANLKAEQETYKLAMIAADQLFTEKDYAAALLEYRKAADIFQAEEYPRQKIDEIDGILTGIEQQRMLDENYANAINTADGHFNSGEFTLAKTEFEKASGLKAGEEYPKDKIAEIDGILAEQARKQEIEDNYNAAIASADEFFLDEQYEEAKTAYQEALTAKPEDAYASEKVIEIDKILAETSRLQGIEDGYNEAIKTADASFTTGDYNSAKDAYSAALEIKANESYPQQKITEIDGILTEIARQKKAIDDGYALAILEADEYLDRGAYLEALQEYENATGIKPDERYPKDKIAEINAKLSELEGERKKAYDAAIAQADSYFDLGNYRSAKASYQTAVNIKPDDKYARDRLDEVSTLYMIELETLKVDYRKYIADADNYFKEKIYDGAIENYRIAARILPDEDYPGKMIARITKIINDNAIIDVNKLAQIIPDNTEKRFSFNPLPASVRKENYILLKAKNVSDHDFKMLVNFGQDNSKAGGVVLQVPKGDMVRDYIIRIGALYKWFSEDNNWLSIYPEGGDIEVALIRISKSD